MTASFAVTTGFVAEGGRQQLHQQRKQSQQRKQRQPLQNGRNLFIPSASTARRAPSSLATLAATPSTPSSLYMTTSFVDDIFISTATTTTTPPTTTTYDAVMPSTETLLGMGFIVVLCGVAAWVWSEQVVPVSRTKLALSKKDGEVKAYLDELQAAAAAASTAVPDKSAVATTTRYSNVDEEDDESRQGDYDPTLRLASTTTVDVTDADVATTTKVSDRAFERWLFTDWLQNNKSASVKGGRKKEPALPILKKAKWNSGDNPVVVAAALMIIGLVVTSVVEQVSALRS